MDDFSRESLGNRAYRAIKELIVTGELPPGEEVPETVLAKRLGISRSPVKAALTRLQDDGLVTAEAWKIPRVVPLDRKYVTNVYQLRRALDTLCAEQSVPRIPAAEIDSFEAELDKVGAQVEQGVVEPVRFANFHFHDLLIKYSDNELLQAAVERLQDHLARVRNASPRDNDEWLRLEYAMLRDEIAAVRARDPERLVQLLRTHLDRFREQIVVAWPAGDGTGTAPAASRPV